MHFASFFIVAIRGLLFFIEDTLFIWKMCRLAHYVCRILQSLIIFFLLLIQFLSKWIIIIWFIDIIQVIILNFDRDQLLSWRCGFWIGERVNKWIEFYLLLYISFTISGIVKIFETEFNLFKLTRGTELIIILLLLLASALVINYIKTQTGWL